MVVLRETIFDTIDDLVTCFLYEDRKDDEILGIGDIDEAVDSGLITIEEMVGRFREELTISLAFDTAEEIPEVDHDFEDDKEPKT